MNKEDSRRQQTVDILKDLRQSILDTKEDYQMPEEGLPIELGTFSFNGYTKKELFIVAENLKSKNIFIKYDNWFLDGESLESQMGALYNSENDIIIGHIKCASLGAIKYKIDLEIELMNGLNFNNLEKIDRVHFVEDLRGLINKILSYENFIKEIKSQRDKDISIANLSIIEIQSLCKKMHLKNFCISLNIPSLIIYEKEWEDYIHRLFYLTDSLLCEMEDWDDDFIYFFDDMILSNSNSNNNFKKYFFTLESGMVLFEEKEVKLINKSHYKPIFVFILKNFLNGGELEYSQVVKLYNQTHKKKINAKEIRDHIVNPSKGLQRRLKILKISSLLGKRIFESKNNDTSKFIFNNLKSSS